MIGPLYSRLEHLFREGPSAKGVEVSAGVAVGTLRGPRSENQDRVAVAHVARSRSDEALIAVVCDGMGGMSEGSLAATIAISRFLAEFCIARAPFPARLVSAVEEANRAVNRELHGRGGTTLTAVAVLPSGQAWGVHAGDSRLYGYTEDSGPDLLSQDDTVQGLVRANDEGRDEDELDNRLVQFVGMGDEFVPHVLRLEGGRERTWFVTSDGAHGVGRKLLAGLARNARSVGDFARKLIFVVDAAPLGDNASVAVIRPDDFWRAPPYPEGLSLTIWAPSHRLEMWLPDAVSDLAGASPRSSPPATPKPPKPERKARARRSKTKPDAMPQATEPKPADGDPTPQLNIVFRDPDEQPDD